MRLPLQFFAHEAPQDYPHLNKCPDCETFFADLTCPLCGKVCPEEMRAGNRKPPKQKWEDPYRRGSGRVQFVPWYLSTPFIIVMLFVFPIAGLVLTWMGCWQKKWKILVTVLFGLSALLPIVLGTVLSLVMQFIFTEDINVDLNMPQAEYVEHCQQAETDVVDIFRNTDDHAGEFVQMTVTVGDAFQNYLVDSYVWYYRCTTEFNGKEYAFLIRDFRREGSENLMQGDRITVYGQVLGTVEVSTHEEELRGPCIAMRFAELCEQPTSSLRNIRYAPVPSAA
ncbi:MAG: hypothetical protein IJX62_01500 [Clostridia bacterium]|nr:hypothetical protein [Clostridia bacterium]